MSTPATGTDAPVPSQGDPPPNTTQLYNGGRKLSELPIQLVDLPERLDGYSNYDSWSYLIETTLESADIPQIIRPSIPRPSPSDPSYPLWRRTSLFVKNWLVRQINPHILSRVLRTDTIHATLSPPIPDPPSNNPPTPTPNPPPPPETIFADTIYTLIYQVVMNHLPGHQALHSETAYANCIFMTRDPPTQTPAAFIAAFRHAVHLTNRLWCTVTPYCAALLLLRRVRADFGDALVDGLVRGLDQLGAPRRYMFVEFDTLCDFLIRRAEGEVGGGAEVQGQGQGEVGGGGGGGGDGDGEVGVGVEAQGEDMAEVSGRGRRDGDRDGDTEEWRWERG
ncbi:uncharacterized protein LDX57_009416 [Aspergillus melleus]|uniref:uncharacterized protein n=1 Tax=Aspergillus melleus TaxID=138277 RepID=UPI001E8EBF3D|nr:uncharacterized protein LDX57_009416 [Aspergillus melleus]KAH8431763.1 hypothetical protein LDX57_009416 [Aspergillus melleus]